MLLMFVGLWAAWTALVVGLWVASSAFDAVYWHLHGKHCIYCRNRQSPL